MTKKATVTKDDLSAKVREILVVQLGVDDCEVTPSASLIDDLGADSLDVVELVMCFEEAFDIEIPDEDGMNFKTVGDVETYLRQHTSKAASSSS